MHHLSELAERETPLEQVSDLYVTTVLAKCGGNKTQAARELAIDRRTLYRRLRAIEKRRAAGGIR